MANLNTYLTEDGIKVAEGETVYNYYDMKIGVIGEPCFGQQRWFRFIPADGSQHAILNGARICSVSYAQKKGWPGT